MVRGAGKAEPFRTAEGRSPIKWHEWSLIWTALIEDGLILDLSSHLSPRASKGRAFPPALCHFFDEFSSAVTATGCRGEKRRRVAALPKAAFTSNWDTASTRGASQSSIVLIQLFRYRSRLKILRELYSILFVLRVQVTKEETISINVKTA